MTRRKQWGVRVLYIKHGAAANYWQVWFSSHFFNFLSPLIQCNFLIEPLTIAQIQFPLFQVLRRHPYLLTQINIAFRGGQVDAFFIKYKWDLPKKCHSHNHLQSLFLTKELWSKQFFNQNLHKEHSSKIMDFDTILKMFTQFPAAFSTWGDIQRRGAGQPEQQGILSQLSPDSLWRELINDHWSYYFCEGI